MQDKQILGLLEKYQKQTDPKQLYQIAQNIVGRLTPRDSFFITDKIIGALQSTDIQTQQNFALLFSEVVKTMKEGINVDEFLDDLNLRLSKQKAYSKSEHKHFMLAKYMIYSYIESPKLLSFLLADKAQDDSEYIAQVLIKQMNKDNIKIITQSLKSDFKQFNPRLFSILVALQRISPQQSFAWDKLLQDKVFNREKLTELINQALDQYPKKVIFFKSLILYMERFHDVAEASEIYQEFWEFILKFEHNKSTYLILNLFKHYVKNTKISLNYIEITPLIETWYRAFSSGNKFTRKLANSIEKALAKKKLNYEFFCFIRGVYGYRLNSKNVLAMAVFSKLDAEKVEHYFKLTRKQLNKSTDPFQKLNYLNEIYVLAICSFETIKDTLFTRLVAFVYEKGCTNFEQFYNSLDEEAKQAHEMEETKKKVEDQCQSFYFSLVSRAAKNSEDKEYFNTFIEQLCLMCSKIEENQFTQLLSLQQQNQQIDTSDQIKYLFGCVVLFSFVHYEEGQQILEDLNKAAQDMCAKEPKLKKKVKTDVEKPKKVLTEICIQLLTKSTQYIRDAVNECFKVMQPNQECFDILVDVLTKEDGEYIAEMAQQEDADDDMSDDGLIEDDEE